MAQSDIGKGAAGALAEAGRVIAGTGAEGANAAGIIAVHILDWLIRETGENREALETRGRAWMRQHPPAGKIGGSI